jgi:CrcB protein
LFVKLKTHTGLNGLTNLLLIAGFGALGALLRFALSNGVYAMLGREFPYGTMSVNIIGSLLIGFTYIFIASKHLSDEWRMALIIGFLGAFTTFSTFSLETLDLFESGQPDRAILNIILSVVLCLAACWLGMKIGKSI